jgi:N6-adenosine-specific RNA methylase IME4
MLTAALGVIQAWGFEYKTAAFVWAKPTKNGAGWAFGNGYWTRANTEPCLLATRGRCGRLRLSRAIRQLILAPRRAHSRKPDEVYGRIEALVPGPYLELFARGRRLGWDSWGYEVDTGPGGRRWPSWGYPGLEEEQNSRLGTLPRPRSSGKKQRQPRANASQVSKIII